MAKRFKRTAGGKIKRPCAGMGHLLSGKSSKRKRQLRKGTLVSGADLRRIASQIAR